MTEQAFDTDVVIVGAGPVGLFAVFELGMLKVRCHLIDSLDVIGGQCAALYPEKPIYDIPGFPRILASELVESLIRQAAPFEPRYHLGQRVEGLTPEGEGWRLETSDGHAIRCRAVVIAAGCGAFGPNRPPLEGLGRFEGRSVFYHVDRIEDLRDRRVVIAGGGDSALDWTLTLADVAGKIYLVHRRARFRSAPETAEQVAALAASAERVELVVPYQLAALEGSDDGALDAVVVRTLEGAERRLPADVLLAFFGLSMNLGPIAEWGLSLDHQHLLVEPSTCRTSRPGIFAIGDIARYPGKLKLILSGFAEAATAAHAIRALVHPDQELHWEYSTTKGVPGLE